MQERDFVQELRDWMRDGGVEEWQELCLPPWSRQEDSREPEQAQPQADPGSGQEGPFKREIERIGYVVEARYLDDDGQSAPWRLTYRWRDEHRRLCKKFICELWLQAGTPDEEMAEFWHCMARALNEAGVTPPGVPAVEAKPERETEGCEPTRYCGRCLCLRPVSEFQPRGRTCLQCREPVCLECGDRPAELSLGLQGFGEVCSDCLRKWHR